MTITTLGGTLVRHGRDEWRWSDGVTERRVRDLSPSREWNFRCRTYGGGGTYVEVPRGLATETPTLAWVLERAREGRYQAGLSGDHTGPLVIDDEGLHRAHIAPGEDPLHGHEPMPEQPGPIPQIVLVPVAEWDEWAADHPVGAEWDIEDQDAILARARELGWEG